MDSRSFRNYKKDLGYAKFEGGLADIMQTPRRGRVTHPGGYAGKIGYRTATTDDYKNYIIIKEALKILGIYINRELKILKKNF